MGDPLQEGAEEVALARLLRVWVSVTRGCCPGWALFNQGPWFLSCHLNFLISRRGMTSEECGK